MNTHIYQQPKKEAINFRGNDGEMWDESGGEGIAGIEDGKEKGVE